MNISDEAVETPARALYKGQPIAFSDSTVYKMRALIRVIERLPPLPELRPSKQLIHNGRKP